MNEYEEIGGEDYFIAVLEEIRNENIMRTSMCDCSEDGDGDPCPHGHMQEKAMTEAEWAKEQLKDWEYIPEEMDITEDDVGEYDEEEDGEGEFFEEVNNPPNLLLGASDTLGSEGAEEEWYLDEEDGEWKTR